jgi:hypothetical protein
VVDYGSQRGLRGDPNRQNPALIQNGTRYKRAYAMGNYSKFVRPGFNRVEASPSDADDILVSAYLGRDRIVVVATNASGAAAEREFVIDGPLDGPIEDAVPWITSDDFSLEAQGAIEGNSFGAALPPRSITSFVIDMDVATTSVDAGTDTEGSDEDTGADELDTGADGGTDSDTDSDTENGDELADGESGCSCDAIARTHETSPAATLLRWLL